MLDVGRWITTSVDRSRFPGRCTELAQLPFDRRLDLVGQLGATGRDSLIPLSWNGLWEAEITAPMAPVRTTNGTDGVRGRANTELTASFVWTLAASGQGPRCFRGRRCFWASTCSGRRRQPDLDADAGGGVRGRARIGGGRGRPAEGRSHPGGGVRVRPHRRNRGGDLGFPQSVPRQRDQAVRARSQRVARRGRGGDRTQLGELGAPTGEPAAIHGRRDPSTNIEHLESELGGRRLTGFEGSSTPPTALPQTRSPTSSCAPVRRWS